MSLSRSSDSQPVWLLQWMVTLSIQPTPPQQQEEAQAWQRPREAGGSSVSCTPSPQPGSWPDTTGALSESGHNMMCSPQRTFPSSSPTSSSSTSAVRSAKMALRSATTYVLLLLAVLPPHLQWPLPFHHKLWLVQCGSRLCLGCRTIERQADQVEDLLFFLWCHQKWRRWWCTGNRSSRCDMLQETPYQQTRWCWEGRPAVLAVVHCTFVATAMRRSLAASVVRYLNGTHRTPQPPTLDMLTSHTSLSVISSRL